MVGTVAVSAARSARGSEGRARSGRVRGSGPRPACGSCLTGPSPSTQTTGPARSLRTGRSGYLFARATEHKYGPQTGRPAGHSPVSRAVADWQGPGRRPPGPRSRQGAGGPHCRSASSRSLTRSDPAAAGRGERERRRAREDW